MANLKKISNRAQLLTFLVLCLGVCASAGCHKKQDDVLSDEELKQVQKYADARQNEIQGYVDKAFQTQLTKTTKDWAEIDKVVSVAIQNVDDFKKSKTLAIYCLKTWVQPWEKKPRKGFYLFMVDPNTKKGFFGVFYEGASKHLTIERFGMTLAMLGVLKIESDMAVCEDCEGGNWSVPFIGTMATSLLKLKPVERHLHGF